MEVVAAEPAGYVYDFADEVEAGDLAALHGLCVEFGGVDAAGGDLGLGVAFGSGGRDAPCVEVAAPNSPASVGPVLRAGWIASQRSAMRAGSAARSAARAADAVSRRALRARTGAVT